MYSLFRLGVMWIILVWRVKLVCLCTSFVCKCIFNARNQRTRWSTYSITVLSKHRVLCRFVSRTSTRTRNVGTFSADDVGGGRRTVRVRNQSEISRRDLTKQLSLFLPHVTTVSILPPEHHGKPTDQPSFVDYKTKMIILHYVSRNLATVVIGRFEQYRALEGPKGRRKLTQNFRTLMHIERSVT
jgi:hypothetical protein